MTSQTYTFETDTDGWTTVSGTFNRVTGAGGNGTTPTSPRRRARTTSATSSARPSSSCRTRPPSPCTCATTSSRRAAGSSRIAPTSAWWTRTPGTARWSGPRADGSTRSPVGAANGDVRHRRQPGWNGTSPTLSGVPADHLDVGGPQPGRELHRRAGRPRGRLRHRRGHRGAGLRLRRGDGDGLLDPGSRRPQRRLRARHAGRARGAGGRQRGQRRSRGRRGRGHGADVGATSGLTPIDLTALDHGFQRARGPDVHRPGRGGGLRHPRSGRLGRLHGLLRRPDHGRSPSAASLGRAPDGSHGGPRGPGGRVPEDLDPPRRAELHGRAPSSGFYRSSRRSCTRA